MFTIFGVALVGFGAYLLLQPQGTTDALSIETSGFKVSHEWRTTETVGTVGDTSFVVQGEYRTEAAGVKREIVGKDDDGNLLYDSVNVPETTFPPSNHLHQWRAAEVKNGTSLALTDSVAHTSAVESATERYEFILMAAEGNGQGVTATTETSETVTEIDVEVGEAVGEKTETSLDTIDWGSDSATGFPVGVATSNVEGIGGSGGPNLPLNP